MVAWLFSMCFVACQKVSPQSEQYVPVNLPETLVSATPDIKMVRIPGGDYKPFFGEDTLLVTVAPYLLDEHPVTNSDYLTFVTNNPQWRKSNVKRIFADSTYLRDWPSDLELPAQSKLDAPVVYVSWFAARAYATSVGKRLPTIDEWEFVAMADVDTSNARNKSSYSGVIVDLYMIKDRQFNTVRQSAPNYWGVYNMFDLIWEWTDDFNSVLSTGDSRSMAYDNKKNLFCGGGAASSTDIMNYAAFMRFGFRTSLKANYTVSNLGFRCAANLNNNIQ